MQKTIDLNADIGEGGDFDVPLLNIVSSANISCGAHAGDLETITAAISAAGHAGVSIGAHPSYPDRRHFGRKPMTLNTRELRETITSQLNFLQMLVSAEGLSLTHIKPHGALYNQAAVDENLAYRLVEIFADFNPELIITGLADSRLIQAARNHGLKTCQEAFIDRRYQHDATLVPRTHPEALIDTPEQAVQQTLNLITEGWTETIDGNRIELNAESFCIHGDTPLALAFAEKIQQALLDHGILIQAPQPFTRLQ